MLQNFKLRIVLFVIISFVVSLVCFTSIYTGLIKHRLQAFIASELGVDQVDYSYLKGNLITGFSIKDLTVYSDTYSLYSKTVHCSINLIDLFNGFSNIEFVKFKEGTLVLAGNSSSDQTFSDFSSHQDFYLNFASFNSLGLDLISFVDFNFSANYGQLSFNKLNIKNNSELGSCNLEGESVKGDILGYDISTDKVSAQLFSLNKSINLSHFKINYAENYTLLDEIDILFDFKNSDNPSISIESNGKAHIAGYDFEIDSFDVLKTLESSYKYKLLVSAFDSDDFSFDRIILQNRDSNEIIDAPEISNNKIGGFEIHGLKILNEDFYQIKGYMEYLNDSIYLKAPYLERDRLRSKSMASILGADLKFYNEFICINDLKLKLRNSKPLLLANTSVCSISNRELKGDSLKIIYKEGNILIEEFKFKNSEHYNFKLLFSNFDLDLFRGLKAKGRLSGNLHILDDENDNESFDAAFSNAKVINLVKENIKVDKVGIEGSISNNQLDIEKMDVVKKIGPLTVEGSFSSLERFYSKIVDDLNFKIE